MILGGNTWASASSPTIDSATYNGVASTAEGTTAHASNDRASIRSLINPAAGSNTAAFTFSASCECVVGAISFTGVDQTDMAGTYNGATGTSTAPSVGIASDSTDEMVIGFLGWFNTTATMGADQTQRYNFAGGGGQTSGACSTEPGAAGTVTHSYTLALSRDWVVNGIAINAAAVTARQQMLMMMGTGV